MSSGFRCRRTSWSTLTTGILTESVQVLNVWKGRAGKATGSEEKKVADKWRQYVMDQVCHSYLIYKATLNIKVLYIYISSNILATTLCGRPNKLFGDL
jgi:hypothetical protein